MSTIENRIVAVSEKVEKLPKWAQDHIEDLQRHAVRCQEELQRVLDDSTESQVSFTSHTVNIGDRKYIPADAVRFRIDKNHEIEVRLESDHLHVMCIQGLKNRLCIKPCVTNVVDIYAE